MKRLLLIACLPFFSMAVFAQANCSNPLVVDICPTVNLTGQTNAGMLNDAPISCNITGEDLVYQINAPNGINKLFVSILNATGTMKVSVVLNTCNGTCSSTQNAYTGNNNLSFTVSSVTTYYLWIDAASTVNFNISIAGDTGNVMVNIPSTKGNIRVDSINCATPTFGPGKKFFQVSYNSVYQTAPMTLAPLNTPGTMCITTFLRNKTGIEAVKKFTFRFLSSGYSAVSPVASVVPGFYNPGTWSASYAAGIWTFLFADSAGLGKGDFKPPPDSCLRYAFCFTITPLNNVPLNTNVEITFTTDGFGTGFNGLVHLGCCPTPSPNCLGATPAPGGVGPGTTFGFSFNDPGFLPVELTDYQAKVIGQQVLLSWTTASETNNDYFTVEKSRDVNKWEPVAVIDGAGHSAAPLSYSVYDNNPYSGSSYYRLSQTDYNGLTNVCSVKNVNFNKQVQLTISPNPADEVILIRSSVPGVFQYLLVDSWGNKKTVSLNIKAEEAVMDTRLLTPGIYLLMVYDDDETLVRERIVVSH